MNGYLLRIVHREADDRTDLVIIDAIHERRHEHDFDSCLVDIVDRLQLDIEEIAYLAVAVGGVSDAVKLQINVAQAGFGCFAAKLFRLGELDAVGCRLNGVVSNLARILDRINEIGRQSGLTAGKLN